MNTKIWDEIIELGKKQEPLSEGIANKLDIDDVNTIIATMEFFNATDIWIKQSHYDLAGPPRFRVFDWLAMCVMGRNDDNRTQNEEALKVLVHSYLKVKGNIEDFIDDLRVTDYQCDTSYQSIELE